MKSSPPVVSNVQPQQTFEMTTYTCTASDSRLSGYFLLDWLIPLWMPNWCTLLKAALSASVAPIAWSTDCKWPPLPDADPKLNCLDLLKARRNACGLWGRDQIFNIHLSRCTGRQREACASPRCTFKHAPTSRCKQSCAVALITTFQGCVNIWWGV